MAKTLKENLLKLNLYNKEACYIVCLSKYNNETELLDSIASKIYEVPTILILNTDKLSDKAFFKIIEKLKILCAEFGASIFIKQRADLAFLSNIDGIYLPSDGLTPNQALEILGESKIIGLESAIETNSNPSNVDFIICNNTMIANKYKMTITEL